MMKRALRGTMALVCSLALQACLTEVDLDGEVDESELAVALPPPTNLQVEITSPTGVRVTWTGTPGATRYLIQRGPTRGSETTIVSVLHPTTTWVYNHIPAGVEYCWVVRNLNASNEISAPSNEVCTAEGQGPNTPTNVTATLVAANRIRVAWSPVNNADFYRVYAAVAPDAPVYVGTVRHPSVAFSHTGLAAGTTYRYAVAAVNEVGQSAQSAIVEAATTGAAGPTNVTATAISVSRVQVTWDAVATATSYQVFAAVSPGTPVFVTTVRAPATAFSHTGLTAETTYAYQVRAVTPTGTTALSDVVTATTPAAEPPPPPPPFAP
jgi:predicted phage tail protein